MEERRRDLRGLLKEHKQITMWLLVLIFLGAAAVVMMCLTKDETKPEFSGNVQGEQRSGAADEVVSRKLMTENLGSRVMEMNPLMEAADESLKEAVADYYETLAGHADFVESYNNLCIYTKLGKYKGTYITFVRYDMKIRDIYTMVPGLGTLYLEKDEKDVYQVVAKSDDEEIKEYVNDIVTHEDVQELMSGIQADYAEAAASDAMLAEALSDLKNAYENQTKQ